MASESMRHAAPTRREYVKYGAVVGGSLLAGCTSDVDTDSGGETPEGGSGTVTMSPVGEVGFDEPPETVFTRLTHHAGMAFALGRGDGVNAMHAPEYYDALWNQFVERLPGVSLDWTGLYSSWEPEKEVLYELDSDVHLADPAWVARDTGWSREELDEIGESVGPWFGNSLSDSHQEPPEEWAEGYEYYTLWEQFELVAEAFGERERYDELATIHEDVLGTVEADLPADDGPTLALVGLSDIDEIYVYPTDAPGFLTSHLRPFEPVDAFDGAVASGEQVDMEALLEADPDVILALGGMVPETDMAAIRDDLREHPVAGEIAAVGNDRIYAQGARYQGPILNLFQLEMSAKQLHPEQFGDWPVYESGPYPEIPEDEQLFDRERVANVINGEA